jgi:DNA-binding SARP family transcriptional activator
VELRGDAICAAHETLDVRRAMSGWAESRASQRRKALVERPVGRRRAERSSTWFRVRALTDEHLTSDSIRFRSEAQQALHVQGRARLDALVHALEVVERGEYLPGARSLWADERREQLREAANDARLAAADAAFALGELEQAEDQVHRVLRDDAYRESAWRLSMRIAGALGHDDRVIARFRSCQAALAELATEPALSTRQLLEQLRR